MTKSVPREMHGEPRYDDEYWYEEEAERRPRRPLVGTAAWIVFGVVAVYVVAVGAIILWVM